MGSGRTAISLDDVVRLIRLCELDVEFHIVERDGSDMAQANRLTELSGQQRLDRNTRLARSSRHCAAASCTRRSRWG